MYNYNIKNLKTYQLGLVLMWLINMWLINYNIYSNMMQFRLENKLIKQEYRLERKKYTI